MSDNGVLTEQVRSMRDDIGEIKGAMAKVAEALERLARLEERHANTAVALERAFKFLSDISKRVTTLEQAQPVQTLTSGWIIHLVSAGGGAIAMYIFNKALGG